VYADLAAVAGDEALLALGRNYLTQGEPVKALHVVEVSLAANPANAVALQLRLDSLQVLLASAEAGLSNDYEIYFLQSRIADTEARLAPGESLD